MQIVINIDDETYNDIKKGKIYSSFRDVPLESVNAIANGTPLPKGHGRLIDADALKKEDEVTEWLSLNAVRTGKMLKRFSELFIKKIDAAPTIQAVPIDVLDKIKAEIPTLSHYQSNDGQDLVMVADVSECIDKYREEQE